MNLVKTAEYIEDYKIKITFTNDKTYRVDFKKVLDGPIFEPLTNLNEFKKFKVDPELKVLVWPNGADFAPEFLYELAKKQEESA